MNTKVGILFFVLVLLMLSSCQPSYQAGFSVPLTSSATEQRPEPLETQTAVPSNEKGN